MHEIQIDIIDTERFQRGVNTLLHALVPWVIELGGQPDLLARDAAVLDAAPYFGLVAVGQRRVDVAVSFAERDLDRLLYFVGLGLPRPESESWDLGSRVESECLSGGGL